MLDSTYAVVSYLTGPIADFVSGLRRRLNPIYGDWLAHVSVLPPRLLSWTVGDRDNRLAHLRERCRQIAPFEVSLDGVSTFWPVNGVVYLRVAEGLTQLAELHSLLNHNGMYSAEPYAYVPHVTVVQALDEVATQDALKEVSLAWTELPQPIRFRVDSLVLVGQDTPDHWVDIAPIPLGSYSLSSS
ncbi:MAG: 2'-5' RNA ligase family protein [Acidobacteria bacterium]|nr:2'-5' RNA ligase family protein [Acidobacteriota bacterium]